MTNPDLDYVCKKKAIMRRKILLSFVVFTLFAFAAYAASEKIMVDGSKGKLAAVIQKPELAEGQKCPMVVLMHGFMGNKESVIERGLADRLENIGVASIRFDFNGHGESEGLFQDMTVPNEIEDALKVYEYARSLHYVSDIALSGHSQGGVVAAMSAGELGADKVKCVVLLAPAAVLREDAIRGNTMGARYNPLDPPETVDMFTGLKLGREYIRTAFSLPIYETADKYTGPACIVHGTGDTIVPYTYGERFHDIWPSGELHIIDAADHGFSKHLEETFEIVLSFLVNNLK